MNRFDNGKLLRRWKLGLVAWLLWEPEGFFITPKRTSDAPNGWGPPRTLWSDLTLINPPYGTPSPSGDIQSEPVLINRFQYNKYPDGGATDNGNNWTLPSGETVLDIELAPAKYENYEKPGIYAPIREFWRSETNPNFVPQPIETETGTWYAHWPEDMTFRNDVDKAIFIESNAARVAAGEKPVNPTPRGLGNTAYYAVYQGHKHNSMSHDDWVNYDPGYQYVAERASKEGITVWGENLALVPDSSVVIQGGETADYALGRTIVDAWIASPEHYSTMIHSQWTNYPEGTYTGFAYVDVDHWKGTIIKWRQQPPYTAAPVAVDPPEVGNYAAQVFKLTPATLTAFDSVWEGAAGRISWASPAFRHFKFGKSGWRTNASFNVEYVGYKGRIIATPPGRTVLGAALFDQDDTEDIDGTPTLVTTRYVRLALLTDAPYTLEIRRAKLSDMITSGYGPNNPNDIYVFEAGFSVDAATIAQVSKVLFDSKGEDALFFIVVGYGSTQTPCLASTETNWNNTTVSTYNRANHRQEQYRYQHGSGSLLGIPPLSTLAGNASASSFEDPPGTERATYTLTVTGNKRVFYDWDSNDTPVWATIHVNDSVTYEYTEGIPDINSVSMDRYITLPSGKNIQYLLYDLNFYETVGPAVLETFHYLDIRNDDYISSRTDFTITKTASSPPLGTFETTGSRELYFNDTLIWQGPNVTWETLDYTDGFSTKAAHIPICRFAPFYAAGGVGTERIHHAAFSTDTDILYLYDSTLTISDILTEPLIGAFEPSTAYKPLSNGLFEEPAGTGVVDIYDVMPSFDIDTGLGAFSNVSDTRIGVGFASYKGEYIVNVSQLKYFGVNDVSANPVSMQDDAFFVSYSTLNLETLTTVTPLRKNLFPVGVV